MSDSSERSTSTASSRRMLSFRTCAGSTTGRCALIVKDGSPRWSATSRRASRSDGGRGSARASAGSSRWPQGRDGAADALRGGAGRRGGGARRRSSADDAERLQGCWGLRGQGRARAAGTLRRGRAACAPRSTAIPTSARRAQRSRASRRRRPTTSRSGSASGSSRRWPTCARRSAAGCSPRCRHSRSTCGSATPAHELDAYSAAFLVDVGRIGEFDEAVERLEAAHGDPCG